MILIEAAEIVGGDLSVDDYPWPSTLNGVLWGAFYEASVARRLPRQVFEPPPTVDAGVLVLRRRAAPLIAPELVGDYRRFVAQGFRRGLRAVAPARRLGRSATSGTAARDLDPHEWAELFLRQRDARSGAGSRAAR